jgi:membrane-bound lytic murein transglycosylase D
MPVRALALAVLTIAALISPPSPSAADDSTDPISSAVPEVAVSATPALAASQSAKDERKGKAAAAAPESLTAEGVAENARAAYQVAWSQRQAGDYEQSIRVAEQVLLQIEAILAGDVDAGRRRELQDLRGRLSGVRDAARHDLEKSATADDSKDPKVLSAPAVEDVRLQFNSDVYRYIETFTGGGRSTFEKWLRRSGRYMKLFQEVLAREGMPTELAHLVFIESGFNVKARSHSAAVGPWQFLRSTARLWGLTVNQWVDERQDPEKSTVAAARYLKHLYGIFGDWPLALASYNAGEGTLLRAIKRQGTTNYWDLRLPRETENYVPQFMAVLAIAREPQRYGFSNVDFEDPMDFDELALKGSVDLRAVAKLASCSYEDLRTLNPAVRGAAAPAKDGITTIRVPEGKADEVLEKIGEGSLPAVDLTVKHRVRRGETLNGIARKYHVDASQLARDNSIGRKRPLARGMTLTIHSSRSSRVAVADLEKGDPRSSTAYVPSRRIGLPAKLDGKSDGEGRLTHTVRRGETLAQVAARYSVRTEDVRRWNHLTTSKLRRGTRLKIRTGDAVARAEAAAAKDSAQVASLKAPRPSKYAKPSRRSGKATSASSFVTVRNGDTLSILASRHGTTVSELRRLNRLNSSRIRTGQRLRVAA